MTTYIDNGIETNDIPSSEPQQFGAAGTAITRPSGLFDLWLLPLTAFKFWTEAWLSLTGTAQAKESGAQLPVPAPIQGSKDSEIFA